MPPLVCHFCGAPIAIGEPIPRDSECDACGHDLRCCRNCRHYDPRYNNSCRETMAEPVEDKQRRNFCEYFAFSRESFRFAVASTRATEARARLDALFGRSGAEGDRASAARKKLDALFRGAKSKPDPESESPPR